MVNIVALIAHISLFSDAKIPRQQKTDCMEYLVNCSVGQGGKVNVKNVEKCAKKLSKEGKNENFKTNQKAGIES